ncbi:MAG: tripartite tricarboxylate transporter substrate-binding protein [Planctomycetota bacterium]
MCAIAGCSDQRGYPNRPITLICPWTAGGGTDTLSRQVAMLLEQDLGVPVNVINATGGAGVTGHTRGALAEPDGYTLLMMTVEIHMLHHRGLTNISHEEFQPVALLNTDATAVLVPAESDWKSLDQLETAIRADPGKLNASGTIDGGIWHLGLADWLLTVGLELSDVNWIGMNGARPSLQELVAGGLHFVCCSLPEAQSFIDGGQIRCLGVMADERLPQFPDVPTFKELGLNCGTAGWRGIVLPKETPPAIVARLADALHRVVEGDAFKEFMNDRGYVVTWQPPDEFAKSLEEGSRRFGEILKSKAFQSIRQTQFGPYFFPTVLTVLLVIAGGCLAVTGNLKRGADVAAISRKGLVRVLEVVAWVVVYLAAAPWAGFVATAGVLTLLFLLRLRTRWPVALAVTAVMVPLAYQLFAVWLRVPLPRGWLGW